MGLWLNGKEIIEEVRMLDNGKILLGSGSDVEVYFDATDLIIKSAGAIKILASGDTDDLITITTVLDIPTITATGATNLAFGSDVSMGTNYLQLTEMTAPGAGAANTARLYALEGAGDALTDLCAVFQDGTIDVFAQEATEPDNPIFQFPDNTELSLVMRKPDRKTIQFVAGFPDGREFVMREIRYPEERWN